MSQINSEKNDALSIFDKSQFTSGTATSSGSKSGNYFGESQYEETNSFDSEEAVEDDCSRIVDKGNSGPYVPSMSGTTDKGPSWDSRGANSFNYYFRLFVFFLVQS